MTASAVALAWAIGLLIAVGEVVLGMFRLLTKKPGITGITSPRLRLAAWLLCGTDVRLDGRESRVSLGNPVGGTLQIVIGLVATVLLLAAVINR